MGDLDAALRIYEAELLPAFEKSRNSYSYAITLGKIADINLDRHNFEEVIKICNSYLLPFFKSQNDNYAYAVVLGKITDALIACGDLQGAMHACRKQLDICKELDNSPGICHAYFNLAKIDLANNNLNDRLINDIVRNIHKSYQISLRCGHENVIGEIGFIFGQVISGLGLRKEAEYILERTLLAYKRIGSKSKLADVKRFIAEIGAIS